MKTNIFTIMKTNPLNTNVSLMKTKMLMKTKSTNVLNLLRFSVISFMLLSLASGLYAQPWCGTPGSIATGLVPNNGQSGVMFDLIATNQVTITSFDADLNPASGLTIEAWYRDGTYVGNEGSYAGWTLLGTILNLTSNATPILTPIPIGGLTINAGETKGIYLTLVGSTGMRYTTMTSLVTYAGPDVSIMAGAGLANPLGGSVFSPRHFTGAVNYVQGSGTCGPVVTGLTSTAISGSQIDLAWTNNVAGDPVMIVRNTTNTFNVPANGTAYTVGGSVGGVGTVVFNGLGSAYSDIGLNSSTDYYYEVYTHNTLIYSGAVTTSATTLLNVMPVTAFAATAISTSQIDLSWINNGAGNDVILIRNTSASFNTPVDGTLYTVGGSIGGVGTVIFNGPGTSFSDVGLFPGNTYYYQAYAYNNVPQYSPASDANANTSGGGGTCTGLIISEIDLGAPDWIEIQNVNPNSVDATGWVVAVSNNYTTISMVNPIVWNLGVMPSLDIQYREDAAGPNYWGNNLFWNPGAPPGFTGWAMILDNTGSIVDYVAWGWSAAQIAGFSATINGFPITGADIATVWAGDGIMTYTDPVLERISYDNYDPSDWINVPAASATKGTQNPSLVVPSSCGPVLVDPVTNLQAIPVSSSELALSWTNNTANSPVMVVYNTTNTFNTPFNGTVYTAGGSVDGVGTILLYGVNANGYSHTGLNAATQYYYQVYALNLVPEYSPSSSASATTLCGSVTAFPYTEPFVPWPPNCWDLTGGNQNWAAHAASGSAMANFWGWPPPANCQMTTPPIDLGAVGGAKLSFEWSHSSGYIATYPLDELIVEISVLGSGTWNTLVDLFGDTGPDSFSSSTSTAFTSTPGPFVSREVDISAWAGAVVLIRFDAISGWGCNCFIDNVTVFDPTSPPGCTSAAIEPIDGATNVSILTPLEWAAAFNTDGYYVYFGTDGGGVTAPTSLENGTVSLGTTFTPSGPLAYNTTYYWMIESYNAYGSSTGCTIWSFTTMPDPSISVFPHTETFDAMPVSGSACATVAVLTNNWVNETTGEPAPSHDWLPRSGNSPSSNTGPYPLGTGDYPTGTGQYLYTEASGCYGYSSWVTSPTLNLTSLTSPACEFWYNMYGQSMGTMSVVVSGDNGLTWSAPVWSLSGDQGQGWKQAGLDLSPWAGISGVKVQWRGVTGAQFYSDMCFDYVTFFDNIYPPGCANYINPADGATGVEAVGSLSWTGGSGVTAGYLLYMGTDGGGVTLPTSIYNGVDIGNVNSFLYSGLTYLESYYWALVPYNPNGLATGCSISSFTVRDDPTILVFPYLETFDDNPSLSGVCATHRVLLNDWVNELPPFEDPSNNTDWTPRGPLGTPTGNTGPTEPYGGTGRYLFTESSSCYNKQAWLTSPPFDLTSLANPVCLFQYSMYGATMGSLEVVVSGDGGVTWSPAQWSLSGNQGPDWNPGMIDLAPWSGIYGVKIRWRGLTGTSLTSDMAIDNVQVTSGFTTSIAADPPSVCLESATMLTVTSSPNAVDPLTYQWSQDPTGGTMVGSGVSTTCDYELRLLDDFGDGWNDNTVSVFVNGVAVLSNVTILAGGGPEIFFFTVNTGDQIHVQYFETGGWPYENSLYIYDSQGVEVYADGLGGLTPSTTYNLAGTADCSAPVAGSCLFEIVLHDDFGDGWNGNSVSVFVNGTAVLANIEGVGTGPNAFQFPVSDGDEIHVQYFETGGWPYENYFFIYDALGVEIYSDGLGGVVPSTTYNLVASSVVCPYVPPPPPILGDVIEVTPIAPVTVYTVTVTDEQGVEATASVTVYAWPNPTVDAYYDVNVCTDNLTQIYSAPDGGTPPYTFSWTPTTNISDPTAQNPIVSPTDTTTYYVIVTDANGCVSEPDSVVINTINQAIADIYPQNIVICAGDSVQLTATGGTSYQWVSTPPGFTSTLANPMVAPQVNTTFHVAVTSACGTNGALVHVTVNPLPFVYLAPLPGVCLDVPPFPLTGGFPGGGDYSGYGCSLNTFYPLAAGPGDHTITYTYTDGNGCTNHAYENIHVYNLPTAIAASNSPICEDEQIDLFGDGYGGDSVLTPCVTSCGMPLGYCPPLADNSYEWITDVDLNGSTYTTGPALVNGYDDFTGFLFTTLNAGQTYTITTSVHPNGNELVYAFIDWNRDGDFSEPNEEIYVGTAGLGSPTVNVTFKVPVDAVAGETVMRIRIKWLGPTPTPCETVGYGEIEDYRIDVIGLEPVDLTCFDWTGPLGFTSTIQNPSIPNAIPANSGDYILMVCDANGCNSFDTTHVIVNPLPVADAGADVSICLNECTDLTASGGDSYEWSTGDLTAMINVCPTVTTTYTVTVTDINGCTDDDDVTVTVLPLPTIDAGPDVAICLGECTTLTATGADPIGGAGGTYEWSNGTQTADNFVCPGVTTTYYVTGTDINGCTGSDMVTVTVNPNPTATASSNSPVCVEETLELYGEGYLPTPFPTSYCIPSQYNLFEWITNVTFDGNSNSSGPDPAAYGDYTAFTFATVNPGGSYPISVSVEPDGTEHITVYCDFDRDGDFFEPGEDFYLGSTSSSGTPVTGTIIVPPGAAGGETVLRVFTNYGSPIPDPCPTGGWGEAEDYKINITGLTPVPMAYYDWTGPNGFISGDQNPLRPNMTLADAGTYTLTVTDGNGCTGSASTDVVVNPLPQVAILGGDTMILCQGFGQIIDAFVLDTTNGPFTWSWTPVLGLSNPNIPDPIANPNDTTLYTVAVTDANGCVGYATVYVAVHVIPIVDVGADTILCYGSSVPLTANILNPHSVYTFLWTPATGLNTTTAQSVIAIPPNTITYTANVSDALAPGCVGNDNVTINIAPAPPLEIIGLDTVYCLDAPPAVLIGYVPGGIFGGPGVYTNPLGGGAVFIADSAGVGVHTITYSYVSAEGCPYVISVDVTVFPIPSVDAGPDMQVCGNSPTYLNSFPSGGTPPYSYMWASVPPGFTSPSQNPVVYPTVTTQYVVTVTDANGCTASDDMWVEVVAFGVAIISPTSGAVCEGSCMQLFGNGGTAYQWNVVWGDANSISNPLLQNPFICPDTTTQYELITNGPCGTGLDYVTIVVYPEVIPDFTGLDPEYCYGTSGGGGGACGTPGSLTTLWAAGNSFNGNMFDVIATNTITIASFDVNIAGPTTVEVYYRPGSWTGFNMSSAGWTMLGSYVTTTGGVGTPTAVPIGGLTINAGETYGLYVTTIASGSMSYTNMPPAAPPYSDANITIDGGQGGAYPFALGNANRMWNGNLHYVEGDGSCGLTGVPQDAGGVFTGPGITDNGDGTAGYDPIVLGTNTITYTYTTADGCEYSTSQTTFVHPNPGVFNVGGGGAYCAAGTGKEVYVDGSEVGVTYYLYLDGQDQGISMPGDGASLSFGFFTIPGIYTIIGVDDVTGCASDMAGSAEIIIIPGPVGFPVTGGGSYCNGGVGVEVGLANSQLGATYQMYINGVIHDIPIPGTGSALSFGLQVSPGIYTVIGTNDTSGCTNSMAGSVTVVILPIPAPFNVTGGGSFCFGGNGVEIGLDYSQDILYYELYRDGMPTGNTVPGNGGPITFGDTITVGGNYTVLGINTVSGCTNFMYGSVDVIVLPLPLAAVVTGGGIYCPGGTGVEVGLDNTEVGVDYFLHIVGTSTYVDTIAGTGSAISFGDQTTTFGNVTYYDIAALNTTTGCVNIMTGYATVLMDTNATIITDPIDLTVEEGQNGTFSVTTLGTTVVDYQWEESADGGNTWIAVIDGGIYSGATTNTLSLTGIPVYMDGYQYRVVVNGRCAYAVDGLMSDVANLTVMPIITTIVEDVTVCAGEVIVPISVRHFYKVASISLTLNVDPNVLTFIDYQNLNPALTFGTIFVNQFGNQVIISWFNTQNADIGDDLLMELRFNSTGGTNFITWDTLSPGKCQYNDVNFVQLNAVYKNGMITVWELPEPIASANGPVCWGDDIMLFGTAVDEDAIANWYWTGPNGFYSYDQNPVIMNADFVNEGPYTLTVTDTNECINSATTYVRVDPLPIIYNVLGGGEACIGSGVNINLDGSQLNVTYELYHNDMPTGMFILGTGGPITFGPQGMPGFYSAHAVNDTTGCMVMMAGKPEIVINPLPLWFTVTGGGEYCEGGIGVEIGLTGSQLGVRYDLFWGPACCCNDSLLGSIYGTGYAVNFGNITGAGTYAVFATNEITGCTNDMYGCVPVIINPLPTAFVYGGDTICYGESADIMVDLTGTPPWNIEFSDGTMHYGVFFTPYIYTVYPLVTETFTVLGVTDGNGCYNTGTGSATVVVNSLPVADAGPNAEICLNDCTTLTASGAGVGGSYLWSNGTTTADNYVCPTTTTTYVVTATNIDGCTDSDEVVVTVHPLPTADAGQDIGICFGDCAELSASGGGSYDTYMWSTGETDATINVCPTTTSTYTVTVTNEYGCTDDDEVVVTVNPLPDVVCTSNSPVCEGDDIELYGASNSIIMSWNWVGPNGFYSYDQNPVITGVGLNAAGSYILTVYDDNECMSTCTTDVVVNPLPEIYTVTGGGYYCFGCFGLPIGLTGSEIGIEYTLIIDGTIIDTVVQGTGYAIDFGSLKEIPGVYTVLATNLLTGCDVMMSGFAEIILKPAPTALFADDEEVCYGECVDLEVILTGMPPWILEITNGTDTTIFTGIASSPWNYTVCPTVTTEYNIIIVHDSICFNTGDTAIVTVYPLPQVFTVTGSGYYCSGIGVEVGLNGSELGVDYTLYRYNTEITTIPGTGGPISFGPQIDGIYTAVAINTATECMNDMSGYAEIFGDPNLYAYEVLGGGPYCIGDPGPAVILASSDVGINYTLLLDGISTGQTLPGTGTQLVFANQTAIGIYTILAIDPVSLCTRTMIGSVGIWVYPLPEATITGDATICVGESTTLHIDFIGTAPWVFEIYDGSITTTHTSWVDHFDTLVSPLVTTTYTIPMVMDMYCDNVGQGSATVTVNIPTLYFVTGGGEYCDNGLGHNVGLDGSDIGVEYELYLDGVPTGNILVGTGSPLNFGLQTAAGVYTVVANDLALGCTRNMGGVAIIIVGPLPDLFNVTGGGACCLGCTHLYVGLDGSQYGFYYQLFRNGNTYWPMQIGTGSSLEWGYMTQEGTYTIRVTDPYTGCTRMMNDSATVEFWPIPGGALSGDSEICYGDNTTLTVTLTTGILPWGFMMTDGVDTLTVMNIMTWSYDYIVNPGATTTYTLISIADSLCFNTIGLTSTVTVHHPLAQGYASSNSPICDGGTLQLFVDAFPLADITGYEWSGPNGFTSTLQNPVIPGASFAEAGDYYVNVYDINGCFITEMTSVVVNANPVADAGPDVEICLGECTMLNASGGMYYYWSNGATDASITVCPLVTETYSVTVTNAEGCTDADDVVVTVNPLPNADAGADAEICEGDCTTLTGSGGGTYLWSTGSTDASIDVCPLATTTYTVFVTNSYGCIASDEVTVTVNPLPNEYTLTGGGCYCIGCYGVEIILDGSDLGIEYQLIRNGTQNFGGVVIGDGNPILFGAFTMTGTYTVAATDPVTGCTNMMLGMVEVVMFPLPTATISGTTDLCEGSSTMITVDLTGQSPWTIVITDQFNYDTAYVTTSPYTFLVSPSVTTTYEVVSVTDTVYGGGGSSVCYNIGTGQAVITVLQLPQVFDVSGGGYVCAGGPGVDVTLSDSEIGIRYALLLDGMPTGLELMGTDGPLTFANQNIGGIYTILSSSTATACEMMMNGYAEVIEMLLPIVDFTGLLPSYCGNSAPSLLVGNMAPEGTFAGPGVTDNGDGTAFFDPAAAGVGGPFSIEYTYTDGTCSNTAYHTTYVNNVPTAFNVTGGGGYCAGMAGVDVGLDNSETGVEYQLYLNSLLYGAPVMGTGAAMSLGIMVDVGYYTVVGTYVGTTCTYDMNGDAFVDMFPVPAVFDVTGGGDYCDGTGGVIVGLSGSEIDVDYELFYNSAATGNVVGGTGSAIDWGYQTAIGTYTAVAVNLYGCAADMALSAIVNMLPSPNADAGPDVEICDGDCTTLTATGGSLYVWSTGDQMGVINVCPNVTTTYYVTVTDNNGCSDVADVTVTVNPLPGISAGQDVDICEGDCTTLTASGGVSYSWSNGATTADITVCPIATTTYIVNAVDAHGCTGVASVTVTVNPLPIASAGLDQEICDGECVTLTATGGTMFYWSTGETMGAITVCPSATETYYVTVTDNNGCTDDAHVTVTVNPSPVADAGPDVAICEGECTTLTATGGAMFYWSTGETMGAITVCPTSTETYYVTVTDNNGCSDVADVTVTVNPNPVADAGPDVAICDGDCTTLTATGGTMYLWSTGETMGAFTVCPSVTTTYHVTVTDNNGCSDVAGVTVTVNPNPIADAGPDVAICERDCTTLTATGGTMFLWSTGETMGAITVCPAITETYYVTVTDNNGCSDVADVTVTVNPLPIASAGPDVTICDGDCATLTAGGGMYYEWSTGDQMDMITVCPTTTETYYVTVTTADGCSDVASVTVTVNALPVADAGADATIVFGTSVMLNGSATGNSPFTWLWTPAAGLSDPTIADPDASPAATTLYSLEVTDVNGCKDVDDVEIVVTPGADITGYVNYLNTAATVMNNTDVYLIQGGLVVQTTTTDANGYYQFTSLADDSYVIDASSTKPWGGGNSGDALLIMKHFVGLSSLTGLYLEAADVNDDGAVNTADALNVQQRFVGMIPGFVAGDWVFEKNTVVIAGLDETNDFAALCFGDVNASYTPPFVKVAPTIELQTKGVKEVSSFVEFDLPIYVEQDLRIGAISLILEYPVDMVDVLGVELMAGTVKDLVYTANNGELRISYYNMEELSLDAKDVLLVLNLRAKDLQSNNSNIIPLTLEGRSELADRFATVLSNVKLSAPELVLTSSEFSLGYNYPNPFNSVTEFEYTLPESGSVSLVVYNSIGDKIAVIAENETKDAGTYKVQFDGSQLAAGIYMYKIEVQGVTRNYVKTRSMIITE